MALRGSSQRGYPVHRALTLWWDVLKGIAGAVLILAGVGLDLLRAAFWKIVRRLNGRFL